MHAGGCYNHYQLKKAVALPDKLAALHGSHSYSPQSRWVCNKYSIQSPIRYIGIWSKPERVPHSEYNVCAVSVYIIIDISFCNTIGPSMQTHSYMRCYDLQLFPDENNGHNYYSNEKQDHKRGCYSKNDGQGVLCVFGN